MFMNNIGLFSLKQLVVQYYVQVTAYQNNELYKKVSLESIYVFNKMTNVSYNENKMWMKNGDLVIVK